MAERVYYARCLLGYSIRTVAKKANVSEVTVSKIEHGKPAEITTLKKLSIVLKQPVYILGCFENLPEDTLPQQIRKARLWHGLTKRDFWALIGVNQKTIRLWESNSSKISEESFAKLRAYLVKS
ncbi:MAG: transcriptional regulator [Pelosinus sp.]|nr:transcriptional regulator [Pelosinus sp.]